MDFESLVTRLESNLTPKLEVRARALRANPDYSEVRVASIRHADMIHALGIACVPTWSGDGSEYLSLCAKISKFGKIIVRIDLSWGQGFRMGTSQGYVKKEDRGRVRRIESESDVDEVLKDWALLEVRFDKVAARATPSSRLIRSPRGAPRDLRAVPQNG